MQHKIIILFSGIILFFFSSCDEAYVPISLTPPSGNKVVVLEEYSGASCVPCVEGHHIIENLKNLYGDQFIPITMHTFVGGQGNPLSESQYDFRTQAGHDILEYLGFPQGIPSGVVDRTKFTGGDGLQLSKQQWSGAISEEAQKPAQLLMEVETSFDEVSRKVDIRVSMFGLEDINDQLSLTVVIVEDGIVDWQATPDGHVEDYEHNNILRSVISQTLGDNIGVLAKNESITKNYSFTLPQADASGPWVPANCRIVAYASVNDLVAERKEILQGAEAAVE